jgi:hypothetical protein
MQFIMQPGMVYQYPIWGVGLLLVGLAALGAVLCELAVHQFLSIELRRRHNDVAAAIFSVVGVTFAVLLAADSRDQCSRSLRLTITPSMISGVVVRKRTLAHTRRSIRYISVTHVSTPPCFRHLVAGDGLCMRNGF